MVALPSHVNLVIATATICGILILTRCAYRILCPCKQHPRCHRRWRVDDTYMTFALLPLVARTVLMTMSFVLNPTTSHDPATAQDAADLGKSEDQINQDRVLALKLLVPVRLFYALFLWTLKLCLLAFYSRLVSHLKWGRIAVISMWWIVLATFIAVVIASLTECRPLHLSVSSSISSPPNHCSRGVVNLLVMAVFNALTDIALLALPFPMLYNTQLSRKHKIQLSFLFGIGFVVVAITIIRVPLILISSWASIEIVCACVVANAAFFYALVKDLQSRNHTHNTSSNVHSSNFYMQSLQSTSRPATEQKDAKTTERQITRKTSDSERVSGDGSDNGLV
ncbi:hypothetical protein BGZ61DRAFT_490240 [Ilyonectria robusta]|uniref:uncharacterized protein n=1 Tax=Ilyonectria robusta TaxID=1079257 RepID=UPI001E8CC142|nr:uncharacterized protein BGZ61DRAFT_490240 [Ilyonectria robusta]KAH8736634.1 hypothetical protein BGZ61DRAFT_490240 [Ilyonectria robusta]